MGLPILFWILMLFWLLLGVYYERPTPEKPNWGRAGGSVLLFIILVVLGWGTFGPPIK